MPRCVLACNGVDPDPSKPAPIELPARTPVVVKVHDIAGLDRETHAVHDEVGVPLGWILVEPARHQVNDVKLQFEAVKAGLGSGILPCFLADREPTLRRLPPRSPRPGREIWLLTHADLRHTARVRAFFDYMAEAITVRRALIEGRLPWSDTGPGSGKQGDGNYSG